LTRHTIAADVRGFRFALRADWSDPDSEVEIDASASVDAPEDMDWQETGCVVSDWNEDPHDLPPSLAAEAAACGLSGRALERAAMALAGSVSAHFDDWRAPDLTAAAVLAAATITTEEEA
jgi:hypothetical protein